MYFYAKNIQFFGYGYYNKYVFLISYLGSIYCVTDIPKYVSSENFYELSILEMNFCYGENDDYVATEWNGAPYFQTKPGST